MYERIPRNTRTTGLVPHFKLNRRTFRAPSLQPFHLMFMKCFASSRHISSIFNISTEGLDDTMDNDANSKIHTHTYHVRTTLTLSAVGTDGVVNIAAARAVQLHGLLLRFVINPHLTSGSHAAVNSKRLHEGCTNMYWGSRRHKTLLVCGALMIVTHLATHFGPTRGHDIAMRLGPRLLRASRRAQCAKLIRVLVGPPPTLHWAKLANARDTYPT